MHSKIPPDSRDLLECAIRLLGAPEPAFYAEDVVLVVYNLGRVDGRIQQLDTDEAMAREALRV